MAIVSVATIYDAKAADAQSCVVQQAFWDGLVADEYPQATGVTVAFPGLKKIYGAVALCSSDHAPLIKSITGNIVAVSLWKNANGTATLEQMTEGTALTNYDLRIIAIGQ